MNKKPNVLMIAVDHWPARLLGVAGHPVIKTPTLNTLASNGIRFTNCYSDCPICIPARRTLMTGTTPRTHGDRVYSDRMPMPDVPTLAQSFRDAGYQAYAVGKLHVYPQRNRIGFDDVILAEEARYQFGIVDDYQTWLGENGYLGKEYLHGMGNNVYYTRPWHLPEEAHSTNWTTREMIRMIKRKDPTKPAFFYTSYVHPHPPLVPLQCYLDMYNPANIDEPFSGEWTEDDIFPVKAMKHTKGTYTKDETMAARRAFYALCTHIDHQLRLLIGTLREEKLLDDTIILFTCDHGDMLGNHGMYGKQVFYEDSCNVPLIISGKMLEKYQGTIDDRLACLEDIMPTLLNLCGIQIPETVEGRSLFSETKRDSLFCEISEGDMATRMVRNDRYKLIYYPVGNYIQLFDLESDPLEEKNLAEVPQYAEIQEKLTAFLISNLYNGDEIWAKDGKLVGIPDKEFHIKGDYSFLGQRGGHWPPPIGK